MSSRTALSVLLAVIALASPRPALCDDWASYTAQSTSGDDGLLISVMESGDFDTRASICSSMGKRQDPDARTVLSWLLAGYSKTSVPRVELLLRLALSSLFDDVPDDAVLSRRVSANALVLAELVHDIDGFFDPLLQGVIVRLLPRLPADDARRGLMTVGTELVAKIREGGGNLSAGETSLCFDYLATVRLIGNGDFLEHCVSLARLSRDKRLVDAARSAATFLASMK